MNDKAHFDTMYAATTDPWRLCGSWYEQRKRNLLVACLPDNHYGSVFEPACANGEFTMALAPLCTNLLASDGNARAVAHVQGRAAHFPNVTVQQLWLPDEWPADTFDLVVLSEFLYYLAPSALEQLLEHAKKTLAPHGTLVACHWRPPIEGCQASGDELQQICRKSLELPRVAEYRDEDFWVDVWRNGTQSVAQLEGRR